MVSKDGVNNVILISSAAIGNNVGFHEDRDVSSISWLSLQTCIYEDVDNVVKVNTFPIRWQVWVTYFSLNFPTDFHFIFLYTKNVKKNMPVLRAEVSKPDVSIIVYEASVDNGRSFLIVSNIFVRSGVVIVKASTNDFWRDSINFLLCNVGLLDIRLDKNRNASQEKPLLTKRNSDWISIWDESIRNINVVAVNTGLARSIGHAVASKGKIYDVVSPIVHVVTVIMSDTPVFLLRTLAGVGIHTNLGITYIRVHNLGLSSGTLSTIFQVNIVALISIKIHSIRSYDTDDSNNNEANAPFLDTATPVLVSLETGINGASWHYTNDGADVCLAVFSANPITTTSTNVDNAVLEEINV